MSASPATVEIPAPAPRFELAIVALAAGASRRFGDADKLLADIGGEPLVARSIRGLSALAIPDTRLGVIAVVASIDGPIAAAISAAAPETRLVTNPEPSRGMGTSVAVGIAAVPASAAGALVVPCDMPGLKPSLVGELLATFLASGCDTPVHAALCDGTPVAPMVWPRRFFDRLLALDRDAGGRTVLRGEATIAIPLPADQARDIDTPDDLASFLKSIPGAHN